jgi:hypothetical protein
MPHSCPFRHYFAALLTTLNVPTATTSRRTVRVNLSHPRCVALSRNLKIASYQFFQDVIPPPAVSFTNTTPATIPPPKPALPIKNEPYTPQRSLSLFQSHADNDNPNVIGPESFETLCTAANIPLDGSLPLILAWQMQAKEMAKISKDEWVKATESLK